MKKIILFAMFSMAAWMGANAMNFSRAQAEALYLTDKMAYELNLNDQQYNDAYEINLDYFLSIDSPSDLDGIYYDHRLSDLRCILHDWQYSILFATDYFLRPILWRAGGWFFPIYSYYNRNYFYYGRPSVWVSYHGGHSHYYHHAGFYAHRRPVWNGGLRGHDMHRPALTHHSSPGMGGRGIGSSRRPGGNGYHIDLSGRRGGTNPGSNHGGSQNGGGNRGGMTGGSGNHSGGHSGGMTGGSGNHSGSYSGGMNPGSSRSYGSHSSYGGTGRISRGNSFDGSSSRISGGSRVGNMGSSHMSSGSRSTSPSMGMSHGSSMSRGSSSFGGSRGGSYGGSRGGGMSHGGGGGSRGGGSRGGRR